MDIDLEKFFDRVNHGPLSPLLANLLLDDLDKELEQRGHRFCRYADDCNIYAQSKAAGERVLASVTAFLEQKLRLRVNRDKSAVAPVSERKFLGHRLLPGGRLGIAPESLEHARGRLGQITRRNRGVSLPEVIGELNQFLTGWCGRTGAARHPPADRGRDEHADLASPDYSRRLLRPRPPCGLTAFA